MSTQAPQPVTRGLTLLAAHCNSLDPAAVTARERLDAAIGPELARVLVFALAPPTHARSQAAH